MSDTDNSSDSEREFLSEPVPNVEMYARQPMVRQRSLAALDRDNEEEMRMEVVMINNNNNNNNDDNYIIIIYL